MASLSSASSELAAAETAPVAPEASSSSDLRLLDALSQSDQDALTHDLETFVVLHMSHQRPLALVSSGGTAVDLEVHAVRSLENFSTGLRGAVSVEGFLRRGYAVIHLHRSGTAAAPFARVLAQLLGMKPHAALDMNAVSQLFAGSSSSGEEADDDYVQQIIQQEDPWLTKGGFMEPSNDASAHNDDYFRMNDHSYSTDGVHLSRRLQHSSLLQKTLREQRAVAKEHRLLTIPFRTVDEYLAKLQLCAQAIQPCRALAVVYLAAAVSDFTIPPSERPEHKIQSASTESNNPNNNDDDKDDNDGSLVLRLKPTPKTIGVLRSQWCPLAFCVSFKLETDPEILRAKAEKAVQNYGVHMVIGNILESRHKTVWILHPDDQRDLCPTNATKWSMDPLTKPGSSSTRTTTPSDELEDMLLDQVVQSHFEFIAWHYHKDGAGAEAARQALVALNEKRTRARRNVFWKKMGYYGTELAGWALSFAFSYAATMAFQRVSNAANSWRGSTQQ